MNSARLYLVARAEIRAGSLAALVPELAAAGVDALQLREKELEALDVIRLGDPISSACAAAGIPFVINDRPDIALALGCGVHLGQNDLPADIARRIVGDAIVGRSTHAGPEIDAEAAAEPRPDYIAVGPVFETPTKPGRRATGVELLRYAAERVPSDLPWFAIGGIDHKRLPEVLDAGARRIVVVRAISESPDPVTAAARLRSMLDETPLA